MPGMRARIALFVSLLPGLAAAQLPPPATGDLLVSSSGNDLLLRVDFAGTQLASKSYPGLSHPRGIAVAADGTVYLASQTTSEVLVREFDPAAQLDIVRYRADDRALEIRYSLTDGTATEGQDYFGPGLPLIYFAPGQQAARILIPLGQDARPEQDETFTVELDSPAVPADSGIFTQLTVMIQDDDS